MSNALCLCRLTSWLIPGAWRGRGNPYATTSANGGILVHVVGRGGGDGATFPAQACAWAPVATRRRSPKRHRQSPRSQPGLAPGRRIPPGDGPRRDTVLTFAWDYPWPCFLERETRWGVFRRSRDRLGTCPPARPLVALGAFTPSPGLRSKNLTWGLAVPVPPSMSWYGVCRVPRAVRGLARWSVRWLSHPPSSLQLDSCLEKRTHSGLCCNAQFFLRRWVGRVPKMGCERNILSCLSVDLFLGQLL